MDDINLDTEFLLLIDYRGSEQANHILGPLKDLPEETQEFLRYLVRLQPNYPPDAGTSSLHH